jgi:hypothetical protein
MLASDVRNTLTDVWAVWMSPLQAGAKDWLLTGATVAGSAAVSPFDDDVDAGPSVIATRAPVSPTISSSSRGHRTRIDIGLKRVFSVFE